MKKRKERLKKNLQPKINYSEKNAHLAIGKSMKIFREKKQQHFCINWRDFQFKRLKMYVEIYITKKGVKK